jgi:aldose 1-epimerase
LTWNQAPRIVLTAAVIATLSCSTGGEKTKTMTSQITRQSFGQLPTGEPVSLFTLKNAHGTEAAITNYGGIVVSLKTADRAGRFADIVLGHDTLDGYLQPHPYFGAIIGRYGNRIGGAAFSLNGVQYKLAKNDGANTLHGGVKGFDKVLWSARETSVDGAPALELTYVSKDGEEGYPGTLTAAVTYSLHENNELRIVYAASTDKDTVVNLTNHSYFNLAGQGEGDILSHILTINAARFTPIDSGLIPTGELKSVAGTPFDFRTPTAIGARIGNDDDQLKLGRGYDHNFVLDGEAGSLRLAARVTEPASGRTLEVLTTEPGMQLYTGNFLDGTIAGKSGRVYRLRYGFCLETQHFPDSPNQPAFPSTVLKPGGRYSSTTVYRFGVAN